jgi:anthranilate synthase / indole-3-glycerol phosphate synthase / phosphoribosylanthranilate isomerase
LYTYSLSLSIELLVEVNNAQKMNCVFKISAKIIGVINWNLHDFSLDMDMTSSLVDMVRKRNIVLYTPSRILSARDVQKYREESVNAALAGKALMRADDTKAFI